MRALQAGLLSLCLGAAACSCGNKSSVSPDVRVDGRPADVGIDRGRADAVTPDLGKPGGCGGERTLSPTLIPPGTATPCGPGCKQVSWGPHPNHNFEIAGDILTYVNLGVGFSVYFVDLAAGTEHKLHGTWPEPYDGCELVGTDGKRIVTTCVREKHDSPAWVRSLTVYSPQTRIETDLLCMNRSLVLDSCSPSFISLNESGISIDTTLGACSAGSAYYLPFSKSALTNLAGSTGQVSWVNGQGNKVVWSQRVTGFKGGQIMVYDLDSGKTTQVDPHQGDQWMPRVQGDKIVWVDHRNDPSGDRFNHRNSDIYLHDLSTGLTTPVTTHPALQEWPDVWGDWVVWHDKRANPDGITGGVDVYAKNMKTNQELQITSGPRNDGYPRVDRDRIFYVANDDTTNHGAIFMVDIAAFLAAKKTP